jgi:hypothetical protein
VPDIFRNFIYVRIPNTGSTSFINALGKSGIKIKAQDHKPISREIMEENPDAKPMAFMRHPFEWVHSVINAHRFYGKDFLMDFTTQDSLEFVKNCGTPLDWLRIDGKLVGEMLLTRDMDDWLISSGLKRASRLNVSNSGKPKQLTDEMKEIIRDRFSEELEYFEK